MKVNKQKHRAIKFKLQSLFMQKEKIIKIFLPKNPAEAPSRKVKSLIYFAIKSQFNCNFLVICLTLQFITQFCLAAAPTGFGHTRYTRKSKHVKIRSTFL